MYTKVCIPAAESTGEKKLKIAQTKICCKKNRKNDCDVCVENCVDLKRSSCKVSFTGFSTL